MSQEIVTPVSYWGRFLSLKYSFSNFVFMRYAWLRSCNNALKFITSVWSGYKIFAFIFRRGVFFLTSVYILHGLKLPMGLWCLLLSPTPTPTSTKVIFQASTMIFFLFIHYDFTTFVAQLSGCWLQHTMYWFYLDNRLLGQNAQFTKLCVQYTLQLE